MALSCSCFLRVRCILIDRVPGRPVSLCERPAWWWTPVDGAVLVRKGARRSSIEEVVEGLFIDVASRCQTCAAAQLGGDHPLSLRRY